MLEVLLAAGALSNCTIKEFIVMLLGIELRSFGAVVRLKKRPSTVCDTA
jgi:hypothetical protein